MGALPPQRQSCLSPLTTRGRGDPVWFGAGGVHHTARGDRSTPTPLRVTTKRRPFEAWVFLCNFENKVIPGNLGASLSTEDAVEVPGEMIQRPATAKSSVDEQSIFFFILIISK